MAVFYRQDIEKSWPPDIGQAIKDRTQARLDALQDELKKSKDVEQSKRIKAEILAIKREFNRSKQFEVVFNKKPTEWKNSLDTISAADLMHLDKEVSKDKRGEFLSKSFLYKRITDNEGNSTEEPTDGKNIKEWDILFVDFGKNKSANRSIWLWHMLGVELWYVEVDWKIWVRSIINWRVWYYTKPSPDGYIPVFTGTIVTIPSASMIWDFEKTKDNKLQRNMDQTESDKMNDLYIEKLEQIPEDSNVEVSILMRESYDFLKNKWLTDEQIAGIIANEYQESRCNPRANNNNISFGIFQWKPDRIEKIKKATGIDIYTADHLDQLKALWWEMTEDPYEKKVFPLLKQAKTPSEAATIFVNEFERPADKFWEPIKRGRIAENIYNQFRFINNPELANIAEWPANIAIVDMALSLQSRWDFLNAEHCTDWVDLIYNRTIGKSVYSTKLYYDWIEKIGKWTGLWGTPATTEILAIKPWMHVIVDKPKDNEYNQWKTHSFIALSSPIDGILKVVSYPNNGIPPKIETYDLYAKWRWDKDGKVLRIQGV